jgi:hypothetical protein
MPRFPLTRDEMHHYEESARSLRVRAGVGFYEPFDPLAFLAELGVVLEYPDQMTTLSQELAESIGELDAKEWSGMGRVLPNGKLYVVLNRSQTLERVRVTLLEEVAHHYHGHTPVGLGPLGRAEYHPDQEREAKFTAAAALLPSKVVAQAVYRGDSAAVIAKAYGASVELVEMRIKTLNLWDHYGHDDTAQAAA